MICGSPPEKSPPLARQDVAARDQAARATLTERWITRLAAARSSAEMNVSALTKRPWGFLSRAWMTIESSCASVIALLENFQDERGAIAVPEPLWAYGAPRTLGG